MGPVGRGYGQAAKMDEQDALTRWRQVLCYLGRPGAKVRIKRRARRRERHEAKRAIRNQED